MQQSTTFLMIMSGLMLMFYVFGILPDGATLNSTILSLISNPENLKNSVSVEQIIAITGGLIIGGGIVLGFFVKNMELIGRVSIGLYLLSLMWDFAFVYSKIASAGTVIAIIALLFFGPLLWMWFMTTVEYMFGRD